MAKSSSLIQTGVNVIWALKMGPFLGSQTPPRSPKMTPFWEGKSMIQTGVNVIWPLRMDPILDPILGVPGPTLGDPILGRSRARHG